MKNSQMTDDGLVEMNIERHNRLSGEYNKRHEEIFNEVEQARLREKLDFARGLIRTDTKKKMALDYGCGTGNLTEQFVKAGFETTAADVSEKFLEKIENKFFNNVKTLKLNGRDLSGISDGAFDIAAVYSVLHHVPDYLGIVRELCRVLKPGGVLFLDHEENPSFWNKTPQYQEFQRMQDQFLKNENRSFLKKLKWLFTSEFYRIKYYEYKIKIIRLVNPRYEEEGDIHVWPDDHIEWDKIEKLLSEENQEILIKEDYLLFKPKYDNGIYKKFKDICSDYRLMISRKGEAAGIDDTPA
jgi:ubiquinone/menaquinone biosynthesis C-methylase UbiE